MFRWIEQMITYHIIWKHAHLHTFHCQSRYRWREGCTFIWTEKFQIQIHEKVEGKSFYRQGLIVIKHEWPVDRRCNCGTFSRTRWWSLLIGAGLSFNCWTRNSSVLRRETKTFVASFQNLFTAGVLVWLTGSVMSEENLIGSLWWTQSSSSKNVSVFHFFPSKIKPLSSFCTSHLLDEYHLLACSKPLCNSYYCYYYWVWQFQSSFWNRVLDQHLSHWFPWTNFWLALRTQIVLGLRLEK